MLALLAYLDPSQVWSDRHRVQVAAVISALQGRTCQDTALHPLMHALRAEVEATSLAQECRRAASVKLERSRRE